MAKNKQVAHIYCPETGKRSFETERDAEKALGRAQTKRRRDFGGGSHRGMVVENRYYWCEDCDGFHLTSQSRREHTVWTTTRELALVGAA